MTTRHAVLGIAAVATLGLGVYLFMAVNATPSAAALPAHVDPPAPPQPHEDVKPSVAEENAKAVTPSKPTPPTPTATDSSPPPSLPPTKPDSPTTDLKSDNMMTEASKAYDAGELDEAMTIARKLLDADPNNTRMRRIMVSASCILEDAATAQKHYLLLPANDRETMRIRCARYGVTFTES